MQWWNYRGISQFCILPRSRRPVLPPHTAPLELPRRAIRDLPSTAAPGHSTPDSSLYRLRGRGAVRPWQCVVDCAGAGKVAVAVARVDAALRVGAQLGQRGLGVECILLHGAPTRQNFQNLGDPEVTPCLAMEPCIAESSEHE